MQNSPFRKIVCMHKFLNSNCQFYLIIFLCFVVEGRSAMSASPGEFCVIASEAYKNLGTSSKQDLLQQVEEVSSKEIQVTSRDIRKNGARIFMKIKYLV